MNKNANAISMLFGLLFIWLYAGALLQGNVKGFLMAYLFTGCIIAAGMWLQLKCLEKREATIKFMYRHYSFLKIIVAWLPMLYLQKVTNWVYSQKV